MQRLIVGAMVAGGNRLSLTGAAAETGVPDIP